MVHNDVWVTVGDDGVVRAPSSFLRVPAGVNIGKKPKSAKEQVIENFNGGWFDGTAANYCTEDAMFNPPGAPPMPIDAMLGMMSPMKQAFPDWTPVLHSTKINSDGSVTAVTQQVMGRAKASMPAMGPFPAVNVKAMPLLARITEASFPCEVGTYTFNEDGSKITSGSYKGSTRSGGNPTPWFTERWNKKGDLSDIGFGLLYAWMGVTLETPENPNMTACKEFYAAQTKMATGDITPAVMQEMSGIMAGACSAMLEMEVNKGNFGEQIVQGGFGTVMGAIFPTWMGFVNTRYENTNFELRGDNVVVVTQSADSHLPDKDGKPIPGTENNAFVCTQTMTYNGDGKICKWGQDYDHRLIARARATAALAIFNAGFFDGTSTSVCTDDCTFNPPGAPPMPVAAMMEMMPFVKAAYPNWEGKLVSVVLNADNKTVTAVTQQCCGKMEADMAAIGPFPAVALAGAPESCKTTDAKFPQEIGSYTFTADFQKVTSGSYGGKIEAGGDPTPALLATWDQKGDLSDVGFGALYSWMGVTLEAPPAAAAAVAAAAAFDAAVSDGSGPAATPAESTANVALHAIAVDAGLMPRINPGFPDKEALVAAFQSGWFDGSAAQYCTEDATFNPPGAPPMPISVMLGMMGPVKAAFPSWESKVISFEMNDDGTATVVTQQCCGKMEGDMAAMGPFPAVALADASSMAKTTDCTLPYEVGTYTFSADGSKITGGAYEGKTQDGGDPTPWIVIKWNKKGDLSDVGFGLLYTWMGVNLPPPPSASNDQLPGPAAPAPETAVPATAPAATPGAAPAAAEMGKKKKKKKKNNNKKKK